MLPPVKADRSESRINKVLQLSRLTSRDYVVLRIRLLQHQVHGLDVFGRPSPIPLNVYITKGKLLPFSPGNPAGGTHNLLGDKTLWAQRGFVVKKNARTSEDFVSFPIVGYLPESGRF